MAESDSARGRRLDGRVALVTGAGRGIGAAVARRFHAEGARVVANDVDGDAAEALAKEVDGVALAADVADPIAVRGLFENLAARFGRLDVLVNNAGIGLPPERAQAVAAQMLQQMADLATEGRVRSTVRATVDLSDAEWRRMLAVHLDGTFFCSREALRLMEPQRSGAIVNLASIMGTSGGAGAPHYCAAKGGVLALTRALAREVAPLGIRVNAIAPGWIETDMTAPLAAAYPLLRAQTPLGRLGTADDVAWAAVYLGSDEAAFVTGTVLSPNGGWYMSQ